MKITKSKFISVLLLVLLIFVGRVIIQEICSEDINISDEITEKESLKIAVHVAGEVNKPGLYTLDIGTRLDDAIKVAGGISDNADLSRVNLAEILKDGQKIIIPSKEKVMVYESSNTIKDKDGEKSSKKIVIEDFNMMTKDELQSIPGIGPVLAQNIIDFRDSNGSFIKSDDLINVKGIGEKKLIKLKEYID